MAQVRPYYADKGLSAAHYDVVTAADVRLAGDLDIYAALAAPPARILELGCGTGRLAVPLARQGFSIIGVDLSAAMLAQANAKRATLPPAMSERLVFRRGDMTSLALGETFDVVICPFFTLAHVPAGAAWKNTFGVMAKHLRPQGLAAVHLPLLEVMKAPAPPSTLAVMDEPLPGGGRLQLFVRARQFRAPPGRLDQVVEYLELDAQGRPLRRSAERLTYFLADPTPFAEAAGLRPERPPIPLGGVGEIYVFRKE